MPTSPPAAGTLAALRVGAPATIPAGALGGTPGVSPPAGTTTGSCVAGGGCTGAESGAAVALSSVAPVVVALAAGVGPGEGEGAACGVALTGGG